ncbi:ImmA/IrrE family metallo-endopeptidase [Burkholderia cenocepacia]|uniref:ImmA/IrrE family metallo-endopeptidase n=1 Tax=Burkholderia cenocepacia TaxID=95486 RepID=UPI002ABDBD56|nr:ImmA/IrrE family metallo-endopeptidase [Burkholderia cenocepacia]
MKIDPTAFRTPGQYIQALLDAREWSKRVLAVILGVDDSSINRLVSDKRPVDAAMAISLEEIFEVPAEHFLDLQKSFDLAKARISAIPDPNRATRAQLFGGLPVAEMIKRGWLEADDPRNVQAVELALAKFFKAESPDAIEVLPHAAKKTLVHGDPTPTQIAWLYRVREVASEMLVPKYTPQLGKQAVVKLTALLAAAEEARKVPKILAECGIRFVLVESLTSAKIDGVCMWLNEHSPVIGMTLRHDRLDNFWFVLRHELEHVIQGHGRDAIILDTELEGERAGTGETISQEEQVANAAAAEFCVPKKKMDSFIARKAPFFAERDLLGFAKTINVHPGLIAGQLQHRTGRYDRFRAHLVKIRSIVAPSAIVDGWGDVAPVGL